MKIIVELEIGGNEEEALRVVNRVLDDGVFQDALNEFDLDGGSLEVTSALCFEGEVEAAS